MFTIVSQEELEDLQRFVDARVLQSANLEAQTEELDFTDNDVGVDVANAIGQGLQTSHTLTRLYLSGNGIGDRCGTLCPPPPFFFANEQGVHDCW